MNPQTAMGRRDIRRALKRLGVSQRQAARLIGKSPAMVSEVLAGLKKSAPVLGALRGLALAGVRSVHANSMHQMVSGTQAIRGRGRNGGRP